MKYVTGIWMAFFVVLLSACEKEESVTATLSPDIEFVTGKSPFQEDSIIHAAKGKKFTIEAILRDEAGLKSFHVYYPDWYLDNTIDLARYYPDQVLKVYDLSYNFTVPGDVDEENEYVIKLSATNHGGLTSQRNLIIRLDGDYEAPKISEIVPGNNATVSASNFSIQFKVQENVQLKYILFEFPFRNVYDSITSFRGGKGYTYNESYNGLPAGSYNFSIKAVDMFENTRERYINFSISD